MTVENMIRELRRLEEKHKNDKVDTFENNWSAMCHDVADKLEEQNKDFYSLKENLMDTIKSLAYDVAKYQYPNQYDYTKEQIENIILCAGLDGKYLDD